MSLFQTLRTDHGIWKVLVDGKEIPEVGESQIPGGYDVDMVSQQPARAINTTLDFLQRLPQGRARGHHLRPAPGGQDRPVRVRPRDSTPSGSSASGRIPCPSIR